MTMPYQGNASAGPPARKRMTPDHYKWAREQGYSDDEITAQGYDLPNDPGSNNQAIGPKSESLADGLLGVGNELLQGASFGLADEAVGLVSTRGRDAMRNMSREFSDRHPVIATGANVVGGLLSGGLAGRGIAAGARALPNAIGRAVTSTAGQGAIMGGAAGAGAAEDGAGSRVAGGLVGAAGGAVLAPALSWSLAKAVNSKLGQAVGRAVGRLRGMPPAAPADAGDPVATKAITRAMERAGLTPDEITARLSDPAAQRSGLMLADELQNLTEGVTTLPGKGGESVVKSLKARERGRVVREGGAADDVLGTAGKAPMATEAGLKAARTSAAEDLYKKAYTFPATSDQRVGALMEGSDFQRAVRVANKRIGNENAARKAAGEELLPMGGDGEYSIPQLDYAKQYLDEQIAKAAKLKKWGLVRVLEKQRQQVVAVLDDATRESTGEAVHGAARAAWEGPSKQIDALALGKKALTMRDDELQAAVAALSPEERATFRVGLADAMRRNPRWVQEIASDRAMAGVKESTLAAAFDDPDAFDAFTKSLAAEAKGSATASKAFRGSPTAPRAATQADLNQQVAADAVGAVTRGPKGIMEFVGDQARSRMGSSFLESRRDRIASALLKRPGDPGYETLMREIARRTLASSPAQRGRAANAVAASAGGMRRRS